MKKSFVSFLLLLILLPAVANGSAERKIADGQINNNQQQELLLQVISLRYMALRKHGFAVHPVTTSYAWAGQRSWANGALKCDNPLVQVDNGPSRSARRFSPLKGLDLHRSSSGANRGSFSLGLETVDGSTGGC